MNSAFEGKVNWKTIFKNVPNIWSINVHKDLIMLLCPVEKNHITQQFSEAPVHHKK